MKNVAIAILLCLFTTVCYAGPSATLTVGNLSNYTVIKDPTGEDSYRMNSWSLPNQIDKGATQWSKIEFNANIFLNILTDRAKTVYTVECPNRQVERITINASVTELQDAAYFHKNYRPDISVNVSSLNCVSVYAIDSSSPAAGEWSVPFVESGNIKIYIVNYPS